MIRVTPADEPAMFDATVRQPGLRALAEMVGDPSLPKRPGRKRTVLASHREDIPGKAFPPYWTEALPALLEAYGRVCAYMGFYIERVTGAASVDHMLPKSRHWSQVYEWCNYRLACSLMNSRKNDYQDVLNPFEIDDGWFRLKLFGYQVIPAADLPPALHTQVQATIDHLRLNDYECLRLREEYAQAYAQGEITLTHLRRRAPFLAREIAR